MCCSRRMPTEVASESVGTRVNLGDLLSGALLPRKTDECLKVHHCRSWTRLVQPADYASVSQVVSRSCRRSVSRMVP